jgi:hypothetical protein
VLAGLVTVLACLLVLLALLGPDQFSQLTPAILARIPLEGLVAVGVLLVLSGRPRQLAAVLLGLALGLITLVKAVDLGFSTVLGRTFDLVLDWTFFGSGMDYLTTSLGRVGAIGVAIGVVLLAGILLVLTMLSVLRLSRIVVRHRTGSVIGVAVLSASWIVAALLGARFVAGEPIAARSAFQLGSDKAVQIRSSLHDREAFAKELALDRFAHTSPDRLLTALRGKDVILAFVESYGRSAVEDPRMAPGVDAMLDAGTRQLDAAGFSSASGWLTSTTMGGGSWFAHSSLLSGLHVGNTQRYNTVITSNRLTLTKLFHRADWRTVTELPALQGPWPEGSLYGYDKIYQGTQLGYRGPSFSWATMPDQYALAALQRNELSAPGHRPVLAETALVSSHAPWAPLPTMVGWDQVGDGSIFDPMPAAGRQPNQVWPDPDKIRTEYGRSIQYSVGALISFMRTYGTKNTVLVLLGDHQPTPLVTGGTANRDVPISIVAGDPALLTRISGWGWQPGLKPGPTTPVWPMEDFRDRFITAFSPGVG